MWGSFAVALNAVADLLDAFVFKRADLRFTVLEEVIQDLCDLKSKSNSWNLASRGLRVGFRRWQQLAIRGHVHQFSKETDLNMGQLSEPAINASSRPLSSFHHHHHHRQSC
jgi:hypothetical protein